MEFGLNHTTTATFKRGKLQIGQNIEIDKIAITTALNQLDIYEDLGLDKHEGVPKHRNMKIGLTNVYYGRNRLESLRHEELNNC